jgi:hypothetical protein
MKSVPFTHFKYLCLMMDSWGGEGGEEKITKPGMSFYNENSKWASSLYVKQ